MHEPILITGCPRSGTSLVAGAIHMCGAFGGSMRGPNKYNARGMFENIHIVDNIIKPYLRELNVDPLGQYPLPDINTLPIPSDLRSRVINAIHNDGYKGGPWMYKGAKMCLMWPVWHYAFPDAKWIIVRRKTSDIIRSCMETGFMSAFGKGHIRKAVGAETKEEGWLWYVHQHEKRFVEMIEAGMNVKIIWPDRMVEGNYKQLWDVLDWLGLEWNSEVFNFVDPRLWKARQMEKAHG